jgi:hypothetical protein
MVKELGEVVGVDRGFVSGRFDDEEGGVVIDGDLVASVAVGFDNRDSIADEDAGDALVAALYMDFAFRDFCVLAGWGGERDFAERESAYEGGGAFEEVAPEHGVVLPPMIVKVWFSSVSLMEGLIFLRVTALLLRGQTKFPSCGDEVTRLRGVVLKSTSVVSRSVDEWMRESLLTLGRELERYKRCMGLADLD